MKHPEGIDGLTGREPIGAAVSIGIKHGSRGFPIETDKFHIVSPRDVDGVRPYLEAFAFFNNAKPELRKTLKGMLMHKGRDGAFVHRLTMHIFPKGAPAPRGHPNKRPVCEGDGHVAVRWMQDEEGQEFTNIRCPNRQCEYRLTEPPSCKPFAQLLFRLRWSKPDLPTPLVKFTTRSWETTANLLGFFEALETAARELQVPNPTLYGYPFTLNVIERTKVQRKARFPVVVVTPDIDPVEFFYTQRQRLNELQAPPSVEALPDLRVQDDETVYEDIRSVEVGK